MSSIVFQDDSVDRVVFHYNKKHNEDSSIPPWVIKHRGKSYYVNHLEILPGVGFSTKETPDNEHTKAALMIRGKLKIIETDGQIEAIVS